MGIFTDRPEAMERFYASVLGLVVSDTGIGNHFKRRIIFMTGNPEHHHQFVLVVREDGDPPGGALFQVSFKMPSLAELRAVAARAVAVDAEDIRPLNHGNSWSIYFRDPDGNMVEIYTDTGWYVPQPFGDPLDLSWSDDEIAARTAERLKDCEGVEPQAEWSRKIAARLAEAGK
jgi:catechol 2,3-dioxygenase